MNRSILIVICDFLVLSAMSLSIGVGETASSPGGGTVISRTAAQDAHIEQMHRELKKRAQIQSEKAQAESELEKLRAQLAQLAGDVDSRTMKLNETSKALLTARMTLREKEKTLKSRDEELARQNEALKQALANARDISAKYENASAELRHSRAETASRTAELKESKANLAAVSGKLKTAEGRLRETEMGLSYAKGSLSRTEKELAEAKIKEEASTKALYTRGVELEQTRVELANTKRLLDAAVRNAGKTQEPGGFEFVACEDTGNSVPRDCGIQSARGEPCGNPPPSRGDRETPAQRSAGEVFRRSHAAHFPPEKRAFHE